MTDTLLLMLVEFLRLALGLLLALFHRPIANFMLEQDRALVALFHSRGLQLPHIASREVVHNIYFCLGIFMALYEIARIWTMVQP